jgi:hypothetical protein
MTIDTACCDNPALLLANQVGAQGTGGRVQGHRDHVTLLLWPLSIHHPFPPSLGLVVPSIPTFPWYKQDLLYLSTCPSDDFLSISQALGL